MKILAFLILCVSLSASATSFSELPATRTGSIDEIFNSCFADAGCKAQIQPLIERLSDRFGPDLNEQLHSCLNNVRSMSICGAFRAAVLASELEKVESGIAGEHGTICARRLVARAKKMASAKVRECDKGSDSLGDTADGRMSKTSCGADQYELMLAAMRKLRPSNVCALAGAAPSNPPSSRTGSADR